MFHELLSTDSSHLLGPPVVPFYPVLGEGSPTKIDYRKKLVPNSNLKLLEDLVREIRPRRKRTLRKVLAQSFPAVAFSLPGWVKPRGHVPWRGLSGAGKVVSKRAVSAHVVFFSFFLFLGGGRGAD